MIFASQIEFHFIIIRFFFSFFATFVVVVQKHEMHTSVTFVFFLRIAETVERRTVSRSHEHSSSTCRPERSIRTPIGRHQMVGFQSHTVHRPAVSPEAVVSAGSRLGRTNVDRRRGEFGDFRTFRFLRSNRTQTERLITRTVLCTRNNRRQFVREYLTARNIYLADILSDCSIRFGSIFQDKRSELFLLNRTCCDQTSNRT